VRRQTPRRRRSPRGVFRHSGDAARRAAPPGAPRFRPTLAPAGVWRSAEPGGAERDRPDGREAVAVRSTTRTPVASGSRVEPGW